MRKLFIVAFVALVLAACAGLSNAPAKPELPDDSRPTISSVSQYLGGLVTIEEDLPKAENMLSLAHYFDPGSPQIKQELFNARMELNRTGQGYSAPELLLFLQDGKEQLLLSAQDLAIALQIFENQKYQPGMDWVLEELEHDFRSDLGLFTLYVYRLSQGAPVDKAVVKEILAKSEKKETFSIALANVHLSLDPQLSLSLLKNYPANPNTEILKLEIYSQKQDFDALRKLYKNYQYPQDRQNMVNFIRQMHVKGYFELVFENAADLMATQDKTLIRHLAELAFWGNNSQIMQQIGKHLLHSLPEPQTDALISSVLIAYGLHDAELKLPLNQYTQHLFGVKYALDIVQLYMYKNMESFQHDQAAASAVLTERIAGQINEPFLQDLLLQLSGQKDAQRLNLAILHYSEYLIAENRAGREEYVTVIQYLEENPDEVKMLSTLRSAVLQFPLDDFFLNNLGYYLLNSEADMAEAKRLLLSAQSLNPTAPHIADSVAWMYYKSGDFDKALSWIKESIRLSKEEEIHSEIWYHAGLIQLALRDINSAQDCLKQIADVEDEFYLSLEAAIQSFK